MLRGLRKWVIVCSVFFASGVLEAQEVSSMGGGANGVSQSSESSSNWKELLSHTSLNYFATYHGGTVNHLNSPYTIDHTGKPSKSAINFDSDITAAYLISPDIGVGPDIPFLWVPVLGKGFILGDLGVRAFHRKAYSSRGLTISANLVLQAPTSQFSSDRGMILGVKTAPNFYYSIPASRFSIGAWSEAKAYLGVQYDKLIKLYLAPYLRYRVFQNLALNLEYEIESHHDVGTPAMDFNLYQSDFQPGVVWNIIPGVLVNPYLQIFTANKVSADTVALGAVISATVL